ncbi:MAG TPA: hypothetical protein VIT65_19940 [Microlunatus sp.]
MSALALQLSAVLLGLLASPCWFGASLSHAQLDSAATGPDLRWR